jgi:hypothetical protein
MRHRRHPCHASSSSVSATIASARKKGRQAFILLTVLLVTFNSRAQDKPQTPQEPDPLQGPAPQEEAKNAAIVMVPAGTRVALVLTQPIQSRHIHRGDDIYAQITSPVNSGDEVVIPPGTFVQGTVDRLERKGGQAELHLQSMSMTLPDGYVVPLSGPVTLESSEGYALKDPGQGHLVGAFALPAAGAGIGALIGHSVGGSPSTITSTLPPGCTGPPPGCLSSSVTGPSNTGRNTVIGAAIGGAVGAVASFALLFGSHSFFLDVGSPVEMVLQQPITLPEDQVADAVQQSEELPAPQQPIAQRPQPVPPPPPDNDPGTCYTPGTPGTPTTVVPGAPGPDGIPAPPTIIPGTPPTPRTPDPCP